MYFLLHPQTIKYLPLLHLIQIRMKLHNLIDKTFLLLLLIPPLAANPNPDPIFQYAQISQFFTDADFHAVEGEHCLLVCLLQGFVVGFYLLVKLAEGFQVVLID